MQPKPRFQRFIWALRRRQVMDGKSLLIGALVIGIGVLGYLYWDSHENTVFKVPGVEIKKE